MNKITRLLILLPFIFFEVYAGAFLLIDPITFTNNAIIVFGIVMLIAGLIGLIRALKASSNRRPNTMQLVASILDLIIGFVCVAYSPFVLAHIPDFVKICGVIMVIFGIYKLRHYALLNDLHVPHAWILLVSAILTIVLGIIVFLNPFTTTDMIWTWTGIFLICEGAADLATLLFSLFL